MAESSRVADRGFTLVEVVVVVVLLGLISLVIGFAITTVLRVTPVAESQVTNARSIQGLTAWFADDAASASPTSVTPNPPSLLTCASVPSGSGTNLVEFQWSVDEGSPTTFVAAYRLEPDGTGHAVHRYACSGSGATPFPGTTSQKLTGPLADFSKVTRTISPASILLELRTLDGTAIDIDATPRNPDDTLPATTVPATVPIPCIVTFNPSSDPPPPVGRVTTDPLSPLVSDVILNMTVAGDTCGTITIQYTTGDLALGTVERTALVSGTLATVRIPAGPEDWAFGLHYIEVYNDCPLATCASTPLDWTELTAT